MSEGEPTKRVKLENASDEVDSVEELEDAEFESGAMGDIILSIF